MRFFVDSNILLYMHDPRDKRKQAVASMLVESLLLEDGAAISTQVLQEFAKNAVAKLKIRADLVLSVIDQLVDTIEVIQVEPRDIKRALTLLSETSISFWDAMLIAAAERGSCDVFLTEDLNHGQRYGSVLVQNPFLESPA